MSRIKKSGMTPVIAAILMIALTVVLAGVMVIYLQSSDLPDTDKPEVVNFCSNSAFPHYRASSLTWNVAHETSEKLIQRDWTNVTITKDKDSYMVKADCPRSAEWRDW